MSIVRFSGQRLIIFFGMLLIIGVWLLVWRQVNFEYNLEINNASREGMNLARLYEDHIRSSLQVADRDLLTLRAAYLEEGFSGQSFRILESRIREDQSRSQVGIVDEQGILRSLIRAGAAYDISDRDYFTVPRSKESDAMYVGKTILGRQSGHTTIPLSRSIINRDGSFGGVVVIALKTSYFTDSFKTTDLGPRKTISIGRTDGTILIRQAVDNADLGIDVSQCGYFRQALQHQYGTIQGISDGDGVSRIHNYRLLPEYSILVDVAVAEQDVLGDFIKRRRSYLIAASVGTIFILLVCALLIRRNRQQMVLQQQINADAARLRTLQVTTSHLVTDFEDSDSLMQMIVEDALRLVGASHGYIAMVGPDDETWTVRYGAGSEKQRVGMRRSLDEGLIGEVISNGELVYVADYLGYPRRISDIDIESSRSVLALPLKIKSQVVGVLVVVWMHVIPKPGDAMLHVLSQYADIASVAFDRARTHDEMQRLAYADILTGLPNRLSIYKRLGEEMERARRGETSGAVFFIDIDDLKLINDTFGHSYGDVLIIEAGRHIQDNAGENTFVGRLAGDEFVVLLPDWKKKDVADIADRLIRALDRQYDWEGSSVRVSATIGIAVFPEDGTTVEEILKNADAALYAAKSSGKHAWEFYNAAIQQDIRETIVLSNSLHHALAQGELALHYQPQVTPEGILAGFEALLRWTSPQHGAVPPVRFIPIAEQSGLIRPIGAWVVNEACRFAKRLRDMDCGDLRVDVNVSARQLDDGSFLEIVSKAINTAGIKPSQLGIEITESVFMESVQDNAAMLERLRNLGVIILLDDFGEGHSSVTRLFQLPIDTLKLSRTFIKILEDMPQQFGFVAAIVDMAHALGLTVVAEGVETKEQFLQATNCRCDRIQGYFFYRPMPEEEAMRIVQAKR